MNTFLIFFQKMTRSGIKLVGEHSVGMVVPLEKPASPGMSWKIETFPSGSDLDNPDRATEIICFKTLLWR